jgi:hypothetical protein
MEATMPLKKAALWLVVLSVVVAACGDGGGGGGGAGGSNETVSATNIKLIFDSLIRARRRRCEQNRAFARRGTGREAKM